MLRGSKPRSEGRCQFGNSEGSFRWASSQRALVLSIYSNMRLGIAMSYSAGAKYGATHPAKGLHLTSKESSISQASLAINAGFLRGRSSINAPTVVKAIPRTAGLGCKSEVHTSRLPASSRLDPKHHPGQLGELESPLFGHLFLQRLFKAEANCVSAS